MTGYASRTNHLQLPPQGTGLEELLNSLGATRVLICGMATDFCVDNAIRSAVARGFHVAVPADAHTLRHRPHLGAEAIIEHHNWVWANLIAPGSVSVVPSAAILALYGS